MASSANLSEMLIIALGALAVIFAILVLYAISMVSKLSQTIIEVKAGKNSEQDTVQKVINNSNVTAQSPVQHFNDSDDEEDRLVVALAASIMASNDKPDSYFHISKITRIK